MCDCVAIEIIKLNYLLTYLYSNKIIKPCSRLCTVCR